MAGLGKKYPGQISTQTPVSVGPSQIKFLTGFKTDFICRLRHMYYFGKYLIQVYTEDVCGKL